MQRDASTEFSRPMCKVKKEMLSIDEVNQNGG